jgi:hypothetical protein
MLNVVDVCTVDYVNSGKAKAIKIRKLKAMTEIYEYGLKDSLSSFKMIWFMVMNDHERHHHNFWSIK